MKRRREAITLLVPDAKPSSDGRKRAEVYWPSQYSIYVGGYRVGGLPSADDQARAMGGKRDEDD